MGTKFLRCGRTGVTYVRRVLASTYYAGLDMQ